MTCVTVGAGDFVDVVRTTVPAKSHIAVVAIQAHAILLADAGFVVRQKGHNFGPFLSTANSGRMLSTRSMTGFALQLAMSERAARIRGYAMFSLEYGERRGIVVTAQTGIGTLAAIRNIGCRFTLCLCSGDWYQ
jgi:hypothetical protein